MYGVMTDGNGLLYMRARFYSPEIRRFVNRDILLGGVGDGQLLNRFAFVTGQPVKLVDPFGLSSEEPGYWLNTTISITITALNIFDTASDIVYACSVVASAGTGLAAAPAILGKKAAVKTLIKALKEFATKKEALGNLVSTVAQVARKKAGFSNNGIPIILDRNLEAKGFADALRAKGFNVRSITEIFGKDPGDVNIDKLAKMIGAKVLTRDRGRQLDGGFGNSAIQVDSRIRSIEGLTRALKSGL